MSSTLGSQMSSVSSTAVSWILAGGPFFFEPPESVRVNSTSFMAALGFLATAYRSTPAVRLAPANLLSLPSNLRIGPPGLRLKSIISRLRVSVPVPSNPAVVLRLTLTGSTVV